MSCGPTLYQTCPTFPLLRCELVAPCGRCSRSGIRSRRSRRRPRGRGGSRQSSCTACRPGDVRGDQFLDGVAVFDDAVLDLRIGAFVQPDVQRRHAALDVDVADDDLFAAVFGALVFDHRGGVLLQFLDELLIKARQREGHVGIFQRIGHAAHAVVSFHQLILALDELARGFLRRREVVLDDLEDVWVRRQREHQHHQALDAGRDDELVRRVLLVVEEIPIEQVLALLLQAERGVDLGARLARHQIPQE
ncbi:testis-specific Y-encoded-like protein 1, partial [Corchorus capsularis]